MITVAFPSNGAVKPGMCVSLAALACFNASIGLDCRYINADRTGIAGNRNILGEKMLEAADTHILMIDTDMIFPPDLLARLLQHGKDIAGVPYPRRLPPYELLGEPAQDFVRDGLAPFNHLPAGLLLIQAHVLQEMPKPWFFETYGYDDQPRGSEDVNFCRKARAHHFEVWGDMDLMKQVAHIGEVPVTADLALRGK